MILALFCFGVAVLIVIIDDTIGRYVEVRPVYVAHRRTRKGGWLLISMFALGALAVLSLLLLGA